MLRFFQRFISPELVPNGVHSLWPRHMAFATYRIVGMRGFDKRHEAYIKPNCQRRQLQPDYTDRRPSPIVSLIFTSATSEQAADFGE